MSFTQKQSVLLVLVASVLWSFGGVLIKGIHWSALAITATISCIAALIQISFLSCCLSETQAKAGVPNGNALKVVLKHVFFSASKWHWFGALSAAANTLAFIWAFRLTSAANIMFLHNSGIVLVAALSGCVLQQKLKMHDWVAIGIALLGIFLLVGDGFALNATLGTWLGLFCGLMNASSGLSLGIRAKNTPYGPLEMLILANILLTAFGLPSIISSISVPSGQDWFLLLLLGIIPWGISDVLYTLGIKRVPIFRALILGLANPVLTVVWTATFLREIPTTTAVMGAIFIIAAIVYCVNR